MNKKFSIDIKTAKQLEEMRQANNWSWKQMYAYYFGMGVERAEEVNPLDADALRKQVERKKLRNPHFKEAVKVGKSHEGVLPTNSTISYDLQDDEIISASGTIMLANEDDTPTTRELLTSSETLVKTLFEHFNLDRRHYELVKYTPSVSPTGFKVWAKFQKKASTVYDEEMVVQRYTNLLESIGSIKTAKINDTGEENILVINFADIHWNKMPHSGFDADYLAKFEQMIYDSLAKILHRSRNMPISRAVFTLAHDFFQTNDSKGGTKKGTPVSHIMEYRDMFDTGARILANCVAMVGRQYITDCYYIMANHDEDSGWHVSRELKLLFKQSPTINVIVDSAPFHYIEWGNTLIELKHNNLRRNKPKTTMSVTAREAWGRTKYHYSMGGHIHGEYTTKEADGVVAMGSRALSDTDSWHMLEGFSTNLRGIQSYVFNKDEGLVAVFNKNI